MRSRFHEWLPVAGWEIKRMLLRTDFVVSTLLLPVLLVGVSFGAVWFKEREAKRVRVIAVVRLDEQGNVTGDALPPLTGFRWTTPRGDSASAGALAAAVKRGEGEGALILPGDFSRGGPVEFVVKRERPGWRVQVERHVTTLARLERATGHALGAVEFARLTDTLRVSERMAEPRSGTSRGDRFAALVLAMVLFMAVFGTNMYLAIGITGEKQSRVTEVIISAISPQSWIDGKIVAYTIIGLAQPLIWTMGGGIAAVLMSWRPPPAVNPWTLTVFTLYLLLGFVLYVGLFAVVLATVKDLQSTAKIQAYLIFLPMMPILFLKRALDSPEALWVALLSQVPAFSPTLMPVRVAVGGARPWEAGLGLVLLALAAWYMRKAAGTAFRVGMLMYGKELTLPELVRWSKEA
jgi:ABC-2 type transport system permease protein